MVVLKKIRNSHILIPLCICYKAKGDFCFETDRQSCLHTDFISRKYCGNVDFSGVEDRKKKQTTQKVSNVYITGLKEMNLYGIDREKKSWALASAVTEQVKPGWQTLYWKKTG